MGVYYAKQTINAIEKFLIERRDHLKHALDETGDVLVTVTRLATFVEAKTLLGKSTLGRVELEGPQEVVGLLEVGANCVDLVHKVLEAVDAILAKLSLNHRVVGEWETLGLSGGRALAKSTLVDQIASRLK